MVTLTSILNDIKTALNKKAVKTNVTAGRAGTNTATISSQINVPYINVNSDGCITSYGVAKHTIINGGSIYIT